MIPISKPNLTEKEINAVKEVMNSGNIAQGKKVKELEGKFAEFCETDYAVALSSGTAALHTSLIVSGINKDDEVITSPFSFVATANSILMASAKPVFVDIEKDSFNISPKKIEEAVNEKTKAVMPVHLYGLMADMKKINSIAKEKNLIVLEDACQAHGSEIKGKKAGSFGLANSFSLYATKNITCGEGGMITTNSKEVFEKAQQFRNHGQLNNECVFFGYNYRLTDLSASIALIQLEKINEFTEKRIENAGYLEKKLSKIKGIELPKIPKNYKHVFHQFTIRVLEEYGKTRNELLNELKEKGINASIYYHKPIHLYPAYRKLGFKEGMFPEAEKAAKEVLSLPVHSMLSEKDLEKIVEGIE